ncbi:hypothetical protein H632_c2607p0, partial [Helicosporidium sp. ATCC 50920]
MRPLVDTFTIHKGHLTSFNLPPRSKGSLHYTSYSLRLSQSVRGALMLRITRLCLTALALLALWLFLVNSTSPGPFHVFVLYSPLLAILAFGVFLLGSLVYGVVTFKSVPEEAESLQQELASRSRRLGDPSSTDPFFPMPSYTSGRVHEVQRGSAELEEVLSAAATHHFAVLVDYSAAWCGPCRALAPLLDALATEHRGRLAVLKVDCEATVGNQRLAREAGVSAFPTLHFYSRSIKIGTVKGADPRAIR